VIGLERDAIGVGRSNPKHMERGQPQVMRCPQYCRCRERGAICREIQGQVKVWAMLARRSLQRLWQDGRLRERLGERVFGKRGHIGLESSCGMAGTRVYASIGRSWNRAGVESVGRVAWKVWSSSLGLELL